MQNLLNKLSRNGLQTYLLLFITYSFLIIFYDPPLGLMDDFKNLEHSEFLSHNSIILPLYVPMNKSDIDFVIKTFINIIN